MHSHRGSEYLSERHANTCTRFGIQLSASKPGSPWQNGYMEGCIKSIKGELGSLHGYQDMTELYLGLSKAIDYYNTKHIHTALKMAPRAYAKTLHQRPRILNAVFGKRVA